MPIEPGAQARVVHEVTEADTAVAMRTGEVAVVATSRLIAWCEEASLETVAPYVLEGSTSVAMRAHLDHFRPAAVGCQVTSIATLERIEGRRYIFIVSAIDEVHEILATGRIVRVVVDLADFVDSASPGCG